MRASHHVPQEQRLAVPLGVCAIYGKLQDGEVIQN